MPGSVAAAAPATVLPENLCVAFSHSRHYASLINQFPNGESLRDHQVDTSRKRWSLTQRLSYADLLTLRAFYFARSGPVEPFYVYDWTETSPVYSYDPTGASAVGRYTVRFDSPWVEETSLARTQIPMQLVEVA